MSTGAALDVFSPLATCLARIHAAGFVHHRVEPSAITIGDSGRPTLSSPIEGLISHLCERASDDVSMQAFGYSAPERRAKLGVDDRSDVFSLGCTLHAALTGRSALVLSEEMSLVIELDVRIDRRLRELLARAVADPRELRPSAAELARSLSEGEARHEGSFDVWIKVGVSEPAMALLAPAGSRLGDDESSSNDEGATEHQFARVPELAAPVMAGVEGARVLPESALVAPRSEIGVGDVLHGFMLGEPLGEGAHARVFRAQHRFLEGRRAAIKVLKGGVAGSARKRMIREANVLSGLRHPGIVGFLDFGQTSTGEPFIAMELLEGETLYDAARLAGTFELDRTLRIAEEIAAALAVAHEAGFVHRDLKPGNIMLCEQDGREVTKVLDFGIVALIDLDPARTRLTGLDQFVGTPTYMAPEQLRRGGRVGPSSDLYALGVIMYRLLSGSPPFSGQFHDLVKQLRHDPPQPIPEAGRAEALILRLLAKDPAERPAGAREVVAELSRLRGASNDAPAPPQRSRPRAPFVALGASALMLMFVAAYKLRPAKPVREVASVIEEFGLTQDRVRASPAASRLLEVYATAGERAASAVRAELEQELDELIGPSELRLRARAIRERLGRTPDLGVRAQALEAWLTFLESKLDVATRSERRAFSLSLRAAALELDAHGASP
ncbi:MAG: protein kinase [Deltaproteobacteria bacterium]|nr:protein kinase [Deltaproteobacteria bacterium]